MRLTDIFIRRPVLAICANLLILCAGLYSIGSLNVRQYPRSDIAVVTIRTAYIGASADLVRGYITTPLERVIASADGIEYLESASAQGVSTITAHLTLNYDVNAALAQIQSKVTQVRNDLPPEAEAPTINVETTDNRFASMYLSFYSTELAANQITDYLTRVVQPKLSAVAGVQRADILGARTFAMRIWLKPERLAALNITPTEVRDALAANNYLAALGTTKGSMTQVNLIANTDLKSKEEFKQLILRRTGSTVIRLSDVSDVELGAESYDEDVRFGGERATFMGIWVLPTANSLDVIQGVRDELKNIVKELPAGMKFGIPYDSTEYIRDSIREVLSTLSETVLIVIIVIFLFIGSMRSVLIPVVAIPLSLIGATFLMMLLGFTINLLTLLAVVLAVGLVVDDAIVMLENIERHVEEGMKPKDAAIIGARELIGPTIAMTITLAAVYAPIGLQGGLTGTLFREFAFTLAGAVIISGLVALTLSPMMCSKILRERSRSDTGEHHGFKGFVNRTFNSVRNRYIRRLDQVIAVRKAVLLGAGLVMLLAVPFWIMSAKELAPREDQGIVFGIVQASPDSTIDQTSIYTTAVNTVFQSVPEHVNTFQLTNPTGGFSGVLLKPWSQRERTAEEIQNTLWGEIGAIPGVRMILTTPPPLPGGGDFPIEFVITAIDKPENMYRVAGEFVTAAFGSKNFMFADADLKFDLPQAELIIDRDKIAMLGLNLEKIGADLGVLLGGDYVNRFSIDGRSYKVIPQAKRVDRLTPDQLSELYVGGPEGKMIPVSTFASIKPSVQPRQLNRFQQLNSVKIQGVPGFGVSIDQALRTLEEKGTELLPAGYTIDYAGESRQLRTEGNALMVTLAMATVLIFLVLAAQFESFRDPLIILLGSVPLALSGALLFGFLGLTSINIYSQVGLVTLVGLISKNGILIVEFANRLQEQGRSVIEAVRESAATRLRPILMTTVATVVGHLPLVFATGAGSAARNSIGIVLVGGMTIGTLFTLFVVPVIYIYVARKHSHEEIDEPVWQPALPAEPRLRVIPPVQQFEHGDLR